MFRVESEMLLKPLNSKAPPRIKSSLGMGFHGNYSKHNTAFSILPFPKLGNIDKDCGISDFLKCDIFFPLRCLFLDYFPMAGQCWGLCVPPCKVEKLGYPCVIPWKISAGIALDPEEGTFTEPQTGLG